MEGIFMDETEKQQFSEFKRKLNLQAAQSQVTKIEYNLTDATVEKATLRRACQDANALKLGALCVLPGLIKTCVSFLGPKPQPMLIACISFPHGGDSTKTKVTAVKNAFKDGADEAEVTAPISFIKDANWSYVKREFKKLKKAAKNTGTFPLHVRCSNSSPCHLSTSSFETRADTIVFSFLTIPLPISFLITV